MRIRITLNTGLSLGVALVLFFAAARPSVAQDEAKPTPAERFRSVVEGFPAPSAAKGFSFSGTVMMGDTAVGEFRLAAEPVRDGERDLWKTTESVRVELGSAKMVNVGESLLEADLSAVRGRGGEEQGGSAKQWLWERTKEGFRIKTKVRGAAEDVEKTVEGGRHALLSGAAHLLFCRMAPKGEAAEYELLEFDADPDDGKHLATVRLRADGAGEWNGKAALLFTHEDTDQTVTTFALDPESRDILGIRIRNASGMNIELRAGRKEADPDAGDPFVPPAKTSKQAALIIALAFGTHDFALLDRMTDWPSVAADLRARFPGQEFTVDALRTAIKARLDAQPEKKGREAVAPALAIVSGQLKVEQSGDDRATVRFPPVFKNLVLEVEKFGEEWRLVVIPGT